MNTEIDVTFFDLSMKQSLLSFSAMLALTVSLSACTPYYSVHGNLLKQEQIDSVKINEDSQSEVMKKLGSPTTKSTFDPLVWYYIGQEAEKVGVFDLKIKDEQVVVVAFDETGLVKSVDRSSPDRLDIPYVREKTATSGNELTAAQQLMGNLGRFNNSAQEAGNPAMPDR